jgi:hypothetical protein
MSTLSPLECLLHIEEIKRLKASYFRSVDSKDWEGFAAVFTEDATLEVDRPAGTAKFVGPSAIVSMVREFLHGAGSVHFGHMPEIHIENAERATGIWSMEDRLRWPDRYFHGFGHYHEQYLRGHHGWRIHYCRLIRRTLDHRPP